MNENVLKVITNQFSGTRLENLNLFLGGRGEHLVMILILRHRGEILSLSTLSTFLTN